MLYHSRDFDKVLHDEYILINVSNLPLFSDPPHIVQINPPPLRPPTTIIAKTEDPHREAAWILMTRYTASGNLAGCSCSTSPLSPQQVLPAPSTPFPWHSSGSLPISHVLGSRMRTHVKWRRLAKSLCTTVRLPPLLQRYVLSVFPPLSPPLTISPHPFPFPFPFLFSFFNACSCFCALTLPLPIPSILLNFPFPFPKVTFLFPFPFRLLFPFLFLFSLPIRYYHAPSPLNAFIPAFPLIRYYAKITRWFILRTAFWQWKNKNSFFLCSFHLKMH